MRKQKSTIMQTSSPKTEQDFMMLYLEEKFIRMHECLDDLNEKTDTIDLSVKELSHIVDSMKSTEDRHFLTCPNTFDMKAIKEEISENKFFKKYWKVFAISAVVLFLVTTIGVLRTWEEYRVLMIEKNQMEANINSNTKRSLENKTNINSLKLGK